MCLQNSLQENFQKFDHWFCTRAKPRFIISGWTSQLPALVIAPALVSVDIYPFHSGLIKHFLEFLQHLGEK